MGSTWSNTDDLWGRVKELEAEVERLKNDYEGACSTVARMHQAATGEITGPRRGVVEDVEDLRAEVERLRDALIEISGLSSSRIITSQTDLRDIALEALNREPKK